MSKHLQVLIDFCWYTIKYEKGIAHFVQEHMLDDGVAALVLIEFNSEAGVMFVRTSSIKAVRLCD